MATPSRPKGIPATATRDSETGLWREPASTKGHTGPDRMWTQGGDLVLEATRKDGALDGLVRWSMARGDHQEASLALIESLELPQGPPLASRMEATYAAGALCEARFFGLAMGEDTLLVTATWQAGQLHGPLTWRVDLQMNFMVPVLTYRGSKLTSKDIKLPKPHPRCIKAEFVKGKRKSVVAFDDTPSGGVRDPSGMVIEVPGPIREWRQDMKEKELSGYIVRGDLAHDLEAFFARARRVEPSDDARPFDEWVSRLPKAHQPAARALDALVRAGRFPALGLTMDLSSYGFDCVKNGLHGAADPRYVGLASDGSGNMQLLDLETGAVVGYEHEEDRFDPRRTFDTLDHWAFAMVRVEAVAVKRIARKEVVACFASLGIAAGRQELALAAGG